MLNSKSIALGLSGLGIVVALIGAVGMHLETVHQLDANQRRLAMARERFKALEETLSERMKENQMEIFSLEREKENWKWIAIRESNKRAVQIMNSLPAMPTVKQADGLARVWEAYCRLHPIK